MLRKLGSAALLFLTLGASLACRRPPASTPENGASPVAIDAALGNRYVRAGASQHLVARIGLSTERRTTSARPPVNMALLVDTSGSMEGRAIEDARAASLGLLDSLAPADHLSVVVFNSKAEVLLPSTSIEDADMKDLRKKISAMKAQGTTDMNSGLRLAMSEVESHLVKDGVNRVVLLGDGVPNDDREIGGIITEAKNQGISITSLGLGNDYDEILMGRIAQQTGGKFSYVEDSSKVSSFFKEEVVRIHQVVARNAVLELQPGPGVIVADVVGRPTSRTDRGVTVSLGDLSFGEKHEIVVELAAKEAKDGSTVEALDAVLHWQDSVGGVTHEERVFVGAKATVDESRLADGKDQNVLDAAARAKDAATTLQKLEGMRNEDEDRSKAMNAPRDGAAHPTTMKRPSPMPAEMTPAQRRRVHADALQNFQANH